MPKLIMFDLDNTLSESRQKISQSMSILLQKLLEKKNVAVISGGILDRLHFQVVSELPESTNLSNLALLPESGTSAFSYVNSKWQKIYDVPDLDEHEKTDIKNAIEKVLDIEKSDKSVPPLIDDKGDQITYSPTGKNAPKDIKKAYDPDHHRRKRIVSALKEIIPDFEISIGGLTSIDITRKGMDKSFGITKIMELKNLKPEDVAFVGDGLFPGGNDLPACLPGVVCISVSNPNDTEKVIAKIINES